MTPQEARQLAVRIHETWTRGPSVDIWCEELERLDAGTAGTTYARLRREEEHAPSIAKFLAVYRGLHTASNDTEQPFCPMCDKTGWIESAELMKGEITYSQVIPCPAGCEYGAQAKRIHHGILERNARTP
jgi:hypothetical protein